MSCMRHSDLSFTLLHVFFLQGDSISDDLYLYSSFHMCGDALNQLESLFFPSNVRLDTTVDYISLNLFLPQK